MICDLSVCTELMLEGKAVFVLTAQIEDVFTHFSSFVFV